MKLKKIAICVCVLLVAVFSAYLFAQFTLVHPYYDDYGYASLSYGADGGIDGSKMTVMDTIRWSLGSYTQVNGRVFANFNNVLSAAIGGFDCMRVVLTLSILGIYALIFSLFFTDDIKKQVLLVFFLVISHGFFSTWILNYGTYWFIAAYVYVVPTTFFFLLMALYRGKRMLSRIFLPVLAFILCLSSEQSIAMTLVWLGGNLIWDLAEKKKLMVSHISALAAGAVAAGILVLSPGSNARMQSEGNRWFAEMSLFEKIGHNNQQIVNKLFSFAGGLFITLLFVTVMVATLYIMSRSGNKVSKIMDGLFLGISLAALILYYTDSGALYGEAPGINPYFIYFVLAVLQLFRFGLVMKNRKIALLALAAGASMAVLLVVPEIPLRTFIPFMYGIIAIAAFELMLLQGKPQKICAAVCVAVMAFFAVGQMTTNYQGYLVNDKVLRINESRLQEASDRIRNGQEITEINLFMLPDNAYAGQQPYEEGLGFMTFWVYNYYEIPYSTLLHYSEYPTDEIVTTINLLE